MRTKTKSAGDVNTIDCVLQVIVSGYIKRINDQDDIQDRRRKLQSDVEKAIMLDEFRGNRAISSQCIKIITESWYI